MAKASIIVGDYALSISGRFLRIATVRDEPYECIGDPIPVIEALKLQRPRVDIFSYMQEITDTIPRYTFQMEIASLAVLSITTHENWWTRQINDKTRNLVRKAKKSNVDVCIVALDDSLVLAIKNIYDESSVRQGKYFTHFQKSVDTIKRELATFPDRSTFIGAYSQGVLIGFAKLVQGKGVVSLMHIIAKISERGKAPTNALVSKAVEICAERSMGYLHYGSWSVGGLGMFKENHAFRRLDIPRYFVPLTVKGGFALKVGMHRGLKERLSDPWRERFIAARKRFKPLQVDVK